ncbi:MAG: alpha/beta hydrolase [Paracoccus sp. (in: a-proteobacteria)]|nr:alpha/beta hydrolase [Paracoccus sp. (in: a-proteobacteria)]
MAQGGNAPAAVTIFPAASDWDERFANSAYIPGSEALPALWAARAAAYRRDCAGFTGDIPYGPAPRQRLDLIRPEGPCHGLVVFVHGGFWLECGKSDWTDLAEGARAAGWAVALPGYTLAPQAPVRAITQEIAMALRCAAALIPGPIRLAGHSAGGHLVTRMICADSPLPAGVMARIGRVVSVSGLHDLRPLRLTKMNDHLRLTAQEAARESPALHQPADGARLTCWVGADERPEFLRQSRLMATIWADAAATRLIEEQGHNHFSILDALKSPDSPLTREITAPD